MSMIEKQIEELKILKTELMAEVAFNRVPTKERTDYRLKIIDTAIDTIKTQSEKIHAYAMERSSQYYHDGWIPCSERLPQEKPSIFAKFKGTQKWSNAMWENGSGTVIVTREYEDGSLSTSTATTHDGEWFMDNTITKYKIIAWRPLPEPYKEAEYEE